MDKKKYWMLRLFLILFTMSISVAVPPGRIINVHGLFGEVIKFAAVEDEEQEIVNIKSNVCEKVRTAKGVNVFNVWFEILIKVVCISVWANLIKLPPEDTIVTLKVRMDH